VNHDFCEYGVFASFISTHFVQRPWLDVVCLVGTALVFWAGSALWVRTATRSIRDRSEKEAAERIRNARECYDILLQEIQGLLLSFHAAAQKVPPDHESRKALEQALASTDRVVVGARDRISRL
jgi:hypothetical protein